MGDRWNRNVWGASFIYRLYRAKDRTEPYGTPACVSQFVNISPSAITLNFLLERTEIISLIRCSLDSLCSKQGVSKAFSISKKTAAMDILLLKFRVTWSVSLML